MHEEAAAEAARIVRWVHLAKKLKDAKADKTGLTLDAREAEDLMAMIQALRRGASDA